MAIRTVIILDDALVPQLSNVLSEFSEEIIIVGQFSHAADAAAFLQQEETDLLFWDLSADDLHFLQVLRGNGCNAHAILLIDGTDPELITQAIVLGISDCILKPFAPARLRHSVVNFLEQERILHSGAEMTQSMIDQLLHHPLPSESGSALLPKGLNQRTLNTLERMIRANPNEVYTCESLSAASGLSKVTIRNYLNYLIEVGRLSCSTDYETGGRPRVLYRIL